MQYRTTNHLRPIRIGMLSGLTSSESFVKCVEVCTTLWGARYNPILPALASTDRWPEVEFRGPMTPADVLGRWARIFDADIFAQMEDAAPDIIPRIPDTMRGMVNVMPKWHTLLGTNNGTRDYGVGFGVGLLEIARDYVARESSLMRQPPRHLISPSISGHPALSAALFGALGPSLSDRYHNLLVAAGHEAVDVNVADALRFVSPLHITPLVMSDRHLQNKSPQRYEFYVLNEDDPFDLALFWNIRAHEPDLIPLTLELLQDEDVLNLLRSRLATDDNYADSPRRVYVGSADDERLDNILDRLALPDPNVNPLLLPPNEAYGPSDFTPEAFSIASTTLVGAEHGRVAVNVIAPDILRADWKMGLRFANDVTLRSVTGNRLPADVLPRDAMYADSEDGPRVWQMPWRVAPNGFAFFPNRDETYFEFEPPDARAVMRAFFSHAGFTTGTSEQGMLLEQLLERLGGRAASGVVTHEALHVPIENLDGRGTIGAGALLSMLRQHGLKGDAALAVIELLVVNDVLAQGMCQKCPLCNHEPWFPLASLESKLLCEYCRGAFNAALVGDRRLIPALRILPPLDLRRNRQGLLAVLAVVNFLRNAFGSERMTIGAGVKITGNGLEHEYDVVSLARGMVSSTVLRVLFCESSAHLAFNDADFDRFERVLPHFPNAYFAFATLRDTVPGDELARIADFARRNGPTGRPQHKVVVLTSADLTPRGDRFTPLYQGPDLRYFVEKRAATLLAL